MNQMIYNNFCFFLLGLINICSSNIAAQQNHIILDTTNYIKVDIKTPEGENILCFVLNEKQKDDLKKNHKLIKVHLKEYGIIKEYENVYLLDSYCITKESKDKYIIWSKLDNYLSFCKGANHYSASMYLDTRNIPHVNYDLNEETIRKLLKSNTNYNIDSVNYPSKGTTFNGGYKAYFFKDGSVGYFYSFNPSKNRVQGWWHPSESDFEWFYNNVYELTELNK